MLQRTPYLWGPDLCVYCRCSYKTSKQLWEFTFLKDCETILKNNWNIIITAIIKIIQMLP